MPSILDHFDALTKKGLQVIPLKENSKAPLCTGWTTSWNRFRSRELLQRFPNSNIGLLLGDIVDVEGDSAEANDQILDLIGDYPHPSYISKKSIHHLFMTPDSSLSHFRCGEIEFRGHGHQSVLPPSQHEGIQYKWLKAFRFPVPEMPEPLRDFLQNKRKKEKNQSEEHCFVRCDRCDSEWRLHTVRFIRELEAFRFLDRRWECRTCRSVDLRPACRKIKKWMRLGIIDQPEI